MNALPSFGRNDLIRATALVAVVAFPLFAYAGLGLGSTAIQPSTNAAAAAVATEPAAAPTASATPCAEQHWPFFSQDCLRGSTQQPRIVSLTSDAPAAPAVAATTPAAKPAQLAEAAPSKAVKPKKHPKPHVASRSPERRTATAAYAAAPAPAPAPVLMAGW
ncbi:MAG TPA: hypothetical protein VE865_17160 [Bradyrhizobium sp.]|nr:hypothetical protein [Bradyrhizobium sp.]